MDGWTQKPRKRWTRQDGYGLCLLLLFVFLLGLHTILTSVVVTNDAAKYVKRSMELEEHVARGKIYTRHFGYIFLIYSMHSVLSVFLPSNSVFTWIYAGQFVSLLCRTLTVIPMYILFRQAGGVRKTFLTVLIMVCLPEPAVYGADLVREWPLLLFLSTGICLLYFSVRALWIPGYFLVGLAAGLGYLIRPECAQLLLYGVSWLALVRICGGEKMKRFRVALMLFAALLGFGLIYLPYSHFSGRYFPSKIREIFQNTESEPTENRDPGGDNSVLPAARSSDPSVWKGAGKIGGQICKNLIYIFAPPFFLGMLLKMRKIRNQVLSPACISAQVLFFYSILLLFLWRNYGYATQRHVLPVVIVGIGYVYPGLCFLIRISRQTLFRTVDSATLHNRTILFIVLLAGLLVCAGKYMRMTPLRGYKIGYRLTSDWIREHTPGKAVVAVPEELLGMYAEREYIVSARLPVPERVDYIVEIGEAGLEDCRVLYKRPVQSVYKTARDNRSGRQQIVVFKVLGGPSEEL